MPEMMALPSKGNPKIVWGVARVFAVKAVNAVAAVAAKVAEIADAALFAVRAVVADAAEIAVKAAVAVLEFPVRSPTKFVALISLNPDILV